MSVQNLQHYALTVPDAASGKQFYEDFGLESRAEGNQAIFRCQGRAQDQVILVEGPERRLHHICFGTTDAGLATIKAKVEASDDAHLVDPPNDIPGPGIWIRDWEDMLVNVRSAKATASRGGPDSTENEEIWTTNTPGHFARVGSRGVPPRDLKIRPRRLGHVLHFTTDINRRLAYYQDLLGLRL
ncbi:MAG: hypothetical protein O3A21_08635, partial [Proteobacteria bacterium]|nr:hypothetical protein [Pseudomonadota bacterium]